MIFTKDQRGDKAREATVSLVAFASCCSSVTAFGSLIETRMPVSICLGSRRSPPTDFQMRPHRIALTAPSLMPKRLAIARWSIGMDARGLSRRERANLGNDVGG